MSCSCYCSVWFSNFIKIFQNEDHKRVSPCQEIESPQEDAVDGHVSRDSDTAIEIDINNSSLSTKNVNGCNSDYDGNGLSMEVYAIYPCLTVKVFIRMFFYFERV